MRVKNNFTIHILLKDYSKTNKYKNKVRKKRNNRDINNNLYQLENQIINQVLDFLIVSRSHNYLQDQIFKEMQQRKIFKSVNQKK